MKAALGLAACVCLSLSLAAFADTAEKPRYKANGHRCTAEEAATNTTLKVRPGHIEPQRVAVDCRTRTEWNMASGSDMLIASDESRYRLNQLGRGYANPGYVSPPAGVSAGGGLAIYPPRFP